MKDLNTRMIPTNYIESISVDPESEREETKVTSIFTFDSKKRHKNSVNIKLLQTPINYASTIIKYDRDSTATHYVSKVDLMPKHTPIQYAETMYVLPKQEIFTYRCTYYRFIEPGKKWYTTEVNLSPSVSCELAPSRFEESVEIIINCENESVNGINGDHGDGFSNDEPMFRSYPNVIDGLIFTNGDCNFPYINGDLNNGYRDDIEV